RVDRLGDQVVERPDQLIDQKGLLADCADGGAVGLEPAADLGASAGERRLQWRQQDATVVRRPRRLGDRSRQLFGERAPVDDVALPQDVGHGVTPSFPRKRESRGPAPGRLPWTPACAGVTRLKKDRPMLAPQRCRPASTLMIEPVVCVRWVTQEITASATSSASIARFNGVAIAAPAIISSVRPGTKPVWTMPGATTTTRISGPSTRAKAMLIVLSAALEAP